MEGIMGIGYHTLMKETDNVVIVTGAARGIGKEIARAYRGAGALIAEVDREWSDSEHRDERTLRITSDVRSPVDIDNAVTLIKERWGRIDVLVNNAGFGIWKHPETLTVEEWTAVMDTNLRGTFLFSRAVAAVMKENDPGRGNGSRGAIVNIASTRAVMSEPNSEAYAASKGGIVALTHALAASYTDRLIRVNCISPGWIETGDYGTLRAEDHRQHWAGRVGRPEDIASTCLFLTSPGSGFITGANIIVDGGMTRKMIYAE